METETYLAPIEKAADRVAVEIGIETGDRPLESRPLEELELGLSIERVEA